MGNLEALCIDCHNAEPSSKHAATIFDDDGSVTGVKESADTQEYIRARSQIDDVIKTALSLWAQV